MGGALGGIGSSVGGLAGGVLGSTASALIDPLMGALGTASFQKPATTEQATEQYQNAQSGLAQQQAFVNALQAQNGIQNQSTVYNQLAGVANGQGPNPAQAMLNQSTGANIANQAALMAGQRGTGANAGLIARQAAQQGGNLQQQAAGQGATMQAQQSLAALNQMGNIAGQQVGNQGNAISGYNQAAQGEQGQILGAINNQNRNEETVFKARAGMLGGLMNAAGGAASSAAKGATGGQVNSDSIGNNPRMYAEGGSVSPAPTVNGPKSSYGQKFAASLAQSGIPQDGEQDPYFQMGQGIGNMFIKPAQAVGRNINSKESMTPTQTTIMSDNTEGGQQQPGTMVAAHGGKVPAKLSPGEIYLPPDDAKEVVKGKKNPLSGKKVPGKAKVKGDSLKNDTVNATLEEGGIVIPRTVVNSKDPHKACADFVAAHLSKIKR